MSSEENKVLDGVGRDAEVVTNLNGGKQSKTPMALHLVDPRYLKDWAVIRQHYIELYYKDREDIITPEDIDINECYKAIEFIADFMMDGSNDHLRHAITRLETDSFQQLIRIAKVLQVGADRYEPNNWRLIPQESHLNHALIHLVAHLMGDTQDDHIDHALCRLMMAIATDKSEGFDYNKYISKIKLNIDTPPQISFDVDSSKHICDGFKVGDIQKRIDDMEPCTKELSNYWEILNKESLEQTTKEALRDTQPICKYKYDCHYKEECNGC